jgi:hypothetical protein
MQSQENLPVLAAFERKKMKNENRFVDVVLVSEQKIK